MNYIPPSEEELNSLILLQSNLINLNSETFTDCASILTNSDWCSKKQLLSQLIHNIIVISAYRPYSNSFLAEMIVSMSKAMSDNSSFASLLLSSILQTILQRSYNQCRGAVMSLLMYLVEKNFYSIAEVISKIKQYKKPFFEEICFNVFVWLAPEIEKADIEFFITSMKLCEIMQQSIESQYPTVQRFLFDLPKLRENDWQNLKQRRYSIIKIFSSIFKHNDIESLVQLSFHPQFNPSQTIAQSIFETSFVVYNQPSMVEFAAYCGAIDCLDFLMGKGSDPSVTDFNGKTLPEFAVCGGNNDIIELLNENGFDCTEFNYLKARFYHEINEYSERVLLSATYSNNIKVIVKCLEKVTPSTIDYSEPSNGKTALIIASQYGHIDAIRLLLSKGANINQQDNDGLSPLQHACQNGYLDIVKLFLSNEKVDPNLKHKFDMTALHWACQKGFPEIVQLLIDTGKVDVNSRDDENWTPLHWAIQNCHDDVLNVLLNTKGIEINVRQKDEMTPLHFAASNGNIDGLKALLKVDGIEVDAVDNGGLTALHWAAQNGKGQIVDYMVNIDRRAHINKIDDEGWTVLHWAAQNNHFTTVVELCKDDRLDFNVKDKQGLTPFLISVLNSAVETFSIFLNNKKVDVKVKDATGKSALHLAVRNGNEEIIKLLLEDERTDVNDKQEGGLTPLHLAVAGKKVDVVKMLLAAKGINPKQEDEDGTTPEMEASILGYNEIEDLFKSL